MRGYAQGQLGHQVLNVPVTRLLAEDVCGVQKVIDRACETTSILRAYRDAHRLRRHYADDRPSTSETKAPPSYRGIIVVDYFLRGRRRFSDLPEDRF